MCMKYLMTLKHLSKEVKKIKYIDLRSAKMVCTPTKFRIEAPRAHAASLLSK